MLNCSVWAVPLLLWYQWPHLRPLSSPFYPSIGAATPTSDPILADTERRIPHVSEITTGAKQSDPPRSFLACAAATPATIEQV
jgi:hypothetical protein